MRTSRINPVLGLGLALATLAVTSPRPAQAQAQPQSSDARWLPWLGCWQAEGASSDAGLVCVRAASDQSSVEILRMSGTDVESREVVWADGQRHETTRDNCNGWEEGAFSKDGQRVFLSSSYTCDGGVVRAGGGIMALVSPRQWLDVRYVGIGDNRTPWVQKYRLATAEQTKAVGMSGILADRSWSATAARTAAATPPTVDDVIEASKAEPAPVVQAWLAERKAPLELDAKALERMADAGVDSSVIDMAVAVSYPDHFRVNTQAPSEAARDRYAMRGWGRYGYSNPYFFDPFWDMYGFSPFGYAFSPYGYYGYGYGYGYPYGGYYGGYGYGYGYTPVITITNQTPRQHGRVIAGRGYTRGSSSGSTGSTAQPRTSAPRATVPQSSAGRSSGSTGSSGSSGRTAHRRGGGGGGL
jgi:hypothetical protein